MNSENLSIEAIIKAAESGDSNAQTSLAMCYSSGKGVEKDMQLAAFWYTKASEQGDSSAQCLLGMCYENGDGVERDTKKALYWYLQSAEQGDDISQGIIALYYEMGADIAQNFKKAVYWHTKAAEQGNTRSQFHLGMLYENGKGIEEDSHKAVIWYTKAAQQNDGTAQLHLGRCYENGVGVEKDQKKADYWYAKAADDIYALESLDKYYDSGKGKNDRYKSAGEWYQTYASNGAAARNYAYFIREVDEEDIDLYTLSVYWFEQSALKGDIVSFKQLALMYGHNKNNIENINKAFGKREIIPTYKSIEFFTGKFYPVSDKDKKPAFSEKYCVNLQNRTAELRDLTKKMGVLALGDEIKKEKNIILRIGLELIQDGTDSDIIQVIMEFLLAQADDEIRTIILKGIRDIQK